jgi:hypothetical protein
MDGVKLCYLIGKNRGNKGNKVTSLIYKEKKGNKKGNKKVTTDTGGF